MTLKAAAHAYKRAARSAAVVTLSSRPRLEAPPMAVPGDQLARGRLPALPRLADLRDQSAIQVEDNSAPPRFGGSSVPRVLINLLNPKLTISFAFLPQFLPADQPNGHLADDGPERCVHDAHVRRIRLYGVSAATVRTQVISRPNVMLWLRRTFAAAYLLLAGRLPAESR